MLFAPDAFMLAPPDPLWREVQAIGPALLTRRAGMFARYARRQADQYGLKGERAAASRRALAVLTGAETRHGAQTRLTAIETDLVALTGTTPHTALIDVAVGGNRIVRHLEICGRKAPFSATISAARTMTERLVASYGDRTAGAEHAGGVDWKALSHAVRVGVKRSSFHHRAASVPARLRVASARDQTGPGTTCRRGRRDRRHARGGRARCRDVQFYRTSLIRRRQRRWSAALYRAQMLEAEGGA